MAPPSYLLQILERSDYRKQHIVPFDEELPPLGPSSIRVQSSSLALTTNNISYARLGGVPGLDWYDAHPLPFKSGQFSDSTKYARISAWGVGTVIESTADEVPKGTQLFGYLPIASLPVDKVIKRSDVKDVILETTEARKHLMPVYNLYVVLNEAQSKSERYHAYAALLKVLFETSYALNRLSFSTDSAHPPVNPLGLQPPPPLDTWTRQRADLKGATVVIMPGSSKTAFALAYVLRHARPEAEQPRAIVGVSSASSSAFCKETTLYDHVALYQDAEAERTALGAQLGLSATDKVVLADFGAREGSMQLWRAKLEAVSSDVAFLRVGGAIPDEPNGEVDPGEVMKRFMELPPKSYPSNASTMRDAGMQLYGEARYLEDVESAFDGFIEHKCVEALKPIWGQGMTGPSGMEGGWDHVCSGNLGAAEGLVYHLP